MPGSITTGGVEQAGGLSLLPKQCQSIQIIYVHLVPCVLFKKKKKGTDLVPVCVDRRQALAYAGVNRRSGQVRVCLYSPLTA